MKGRKCKRRIWILRPKFLAKNNNMQSDGSRDGRTDNGGYKKISFQTRLLFVFEKHWKANPILRLPHETSTTIYRWKNPMICKHVSTIERGVVHELREIIHLEISTEGKIYLIQRGSHSRNLQNLFRWEYFNSFGRWVRDSGLMEHLRYICS